MLHQQITDKILKAFYGVYNDLGYGFLERVYENALMHELRKMSLEVVRQKPIKVYYDNVLVGEYFADIIVENAVIVELKAVEGLHENHSNQLLNYLKATEIEVGLLLNFGEEPQFVRRILTNDRKKSTIAPPFDQYTNTAAISQAQYASVTIRHHMRNNIANLKKCFH